MWNRVKTITGRIVLGIGIAAGLALIFLVHPENKVPEGRTVIELWQVTGAEDTTPIVPQWFNESQDKIYCRLVGLPFLEIEQKFLTAVVGNVPPDLFEYFGSVAQWSTRGALMPLDEFMERDGFDRDAIFPALWDEMMWDGRTYAIPTGTANEAFFWNKEHFREAGLDPDRPPKTWKELEEYAVKLTKYADDGSIERAGYIPGYWSPFPNSIFLDWPVQLDAKFLSDDGTKVNLTAPANIKALEWEGHLFERLGREQLILKRASFGYGGQHGFLSGQLSMIAQKSSFVQEIERYAPDLDYGVAPFPVPEGGHRAVIAGSVWIGIPTGAKHPEAAWEYIKYYTRTDTQIRAAKYAADNNLAAFFPANIEAANSPAQQSLPHMNVFVESMKWAHSSTVIPLAHTQFWRAYQDAWDAVMRGDKTARQALEEAQASVQTALDGQLAYIQFYRKYLEEHAAKQADQEEPSS
jgi:multiple sugar transport system substrate-binding protein